MRIDPEMCKWSVGGKHEYTQVNNVIFIFQDTVTFQLILATNGVDTYAYVLYRGFAIYDPPFGRNVAIGYSIRGISSSYTYSFTQDAFRLPEILG
jgi:hypothetical protein